MVHMIMVPKYSNICRQYFTALIVLIWCGLLLFTVGLALDYMRYNEIGWHAVPEPQIYVGTDSEKELTVLRDDSRLELVAPRQLLILSYQRCGSSFLGRVFGFHEQVTYMFEPVDGVYVDIYGTKEGKNVPSDITSYNNGTCRRPSPVEVDAVAEALHNILNCHIGNVPTPVLYHHYMDMLRSNYKSIKEFVTCGARFRHINRCRYKIGKLCPDRFNSSATALYQCQNSLEDSRENGTSPDEFRRYRLCMSRIREEGSKCEDRLKRMCVNRPFRAVKTVRATMDVVEQLIERNPNLRVIHLFRDPRAVVLSRRRMGPASFGIYSALYGRRVDVVKEAKLYCQTVLRDIRLRRELELRHPGVIREVLYDQFTKNAMDNIRDLYSFVDMSISEDFEKWLFSMTTTDEKNSSQIATKWRSDINPAARAGINDECRELFSEVEYDWPDT